MALGPRGRRPQNEAQRPAAEAVREHDPAAEMLREAFEPQHEGAVEIIPPQQDRQENRQGYGRTRTRPQRAPGRETTAEEADEAIANMEALPDGAADLLAGMKAALGDARDRLSDDEAAAVAARLRLRRGEAAARPIQGGRPQDILPGRPKDNLPALVRREVAVIPEQEQLPAIPPPVDLRWMPVPLTPGYGDELVRVLGRDGFRGFTRDDLEGAHVVASVFPGGARMVDHMKRWMTQRDANSGRAQNGLFVGEGTVTPRLNDLDPRAAQALRMMGMNRYEAQVRVFRSFTDENAYLLVRDFAGEYVYRVHDPRPAHEYLQAAGIEGPAAAPQPRPQIGVPMRQLAHNAPPMGRQHREPRQAAMRPAEVAALPQGMRGEPAGLLARLREYGLATAMGPTGMVVQGEVDGRRVEVTAARNTPFDRSIAWSVSIDGATEVVDDPDEILRRFRPERGLS